MADTEKRLWAAYQRRRSIANRNALWVHYQPMLDYYAAKVHATRGKGWEADDLRSIAQLALMERIENFDPARGFAFVTFSWRRIVGHMIDAIRSAAGTRAKCRRATLVSIDSECFTDGTHQTTFAATLPARREPCPVAQRQDFEALISGLNRDARTCLTLYFRDDLTMQEIGQSMGWSEPRVSQIISPALRELRKNDAARRAMLSMFGADHSLTARPVRIRNRGALRASRYKSG